MLCEGGTAITDADGHFIARCNFLPPHRNVWEACANARIMSLAPCMIAELNRSHDLLNELLDYAPNAATKYYIMGQLEANSLVLAKARGEM